MAIYPQVHGIPLERVRNAFPYRKWLRTRWILWYAASLHLTWVMLLIFGATSDSVQIASLYWASTAFLGAPSSGFVIAALWLAIITAAVGIYRGEDDMLGFLLLAAQQYIVVSGAIVAGVAICDGSASAIHIRPVIFAVFHSIALLEPYCREWIQGVVVPWKTGG